MTGMNTFELEFLLSNTRWPDYVERPHAVRVYLCLSLRAPLTEEERKVLLAAHRDPYAVTDALRGVIERHMDVLPEMYRPVADKLIAGKTVMDPSVLEPIDDRGFLGD